MEEVDHHQDTGVRLGQDADSLVAAVSGLAAMCCRLEAGGRGVPVSDHAVVRLSLQWKGVMVQFWCPWEHHLQRSCQLFVSHLQTYPCARQR